MAIFENKSLVDISKVNSKAFITNKGMLRILENTACLHSDEAGFGIREIPLTHLSWVQLNWRVKILRRPKYRELLTVRTWARGVTKVSTLRDFEVLDENNNQICIATTKWTLTNIDTKSITKITDDLIKKYGTEEITIFPDYDFKKLQVPNHFTNEYLYTTQRKDIDVNKHMHNLYYLDLAYEALPEDVYFKNEFNDIEIMYKKAILLGDTSKCLYSYENGKHVVVIKDVNDDSLHCIVNLW